MNTAIAERLDEALIEHDAPQEREAWSVTDMDGAGWASRKLQKAYASIQAVSDWEAREIERIREVANRERSRYESERDFFEGHIAQFLLREVADGRKTKSLDLPGGCIQLRARQPKLEILEELDAIGWAEQQDATTAGRFVRIRKSIDKTQAKKLLTNVDGQVIFTETGEVVTWASLEEQADSVSFTPASEEEVPEAA